MASSSESWLKIVRHQIVVRGTLESTPLQIFVAADNTAMSITSEARRRDTQRLGTARDTPNRSHAILRRLFQFPTLTAGNTEY
jgi:hypothetical protein